MTISPDAVRQAVPAWPRSRHGVQACREAPRRPGRIIVGYPPGGTLDQTARRLADAWKPTGPHLPRRQPPGRRGPDRERPAQARARRRQRGAVHPHLGDDHLPACLHATFPTTRRDLRPSPRSLRDLRAGDQHCGAGRVKTLAGLCALARPTTPAAASHRPRPDRWRSSWAIASRRPPSSAHAHCLPRLRAGHAGPAGRTGSGLPRLRRRLPAVPGKRKLRLLAVTGERVHAS